VKAYDQGCHLFYRALAGREESWPRVLGNKPINLLFVLVCGDPLCST
jgi:hypothetical protein